MKSFHIKVTQAIIDGALPEHGSKCMVAQAVRATVKDAYSINVTAESVRFNIGDSQAVTGRRYMYLMPAVALKNVEAFDVDRASVKPFKFTLDGRSGFSAPVVKRGERGLNQKKKVQRTYKGHKAGPRRCGVRRYRGVVALGGLVRKDDATAKERNTG